MPQLRTKWEAHDAQQEIRDSDARFRMVACGRRWGKTELAAHEIFEYAFNNPGTLCWWVAPTYRIADTGYNKVESIVPNGLVDGKPKRSKPKRIPLVNGSIIEFRSTSKEDGLVGEGVHFLVIDEAAMIPERSWKKEMRPTLSDTLGEMLAISTPKGRNWFHDYYQRGESDAGTHDEIASWRGSTYQNPHVPDSEIDAAKEELPERIFAQEYEAEFIDDTGGVFERITERIVADYDHEETDGEAPYYIGVDFARHEDWTVIIVLDAEGRLVHYKRIRHRSWPQIQSAVEKAYERYPGPTYVDGSRDNKIVSDLEAVGVEVEPISFTSQRKAQMVERLAATIEQEGLTIPDLPQVVTELQAFEYDVTRAGNVRYHAPDGFHDDTVDALCLANFARTGATRKTLTRGTRTAHWTKKSFLT